MGKVDQDLQALDDDVVRLLALDVDHEADAACVVLVPGVIQTLRCRESVHGEVSIPAEELLVQQEICLDEYKHV
jgi:hypothetical protein